MSEHTPVDDVLRVAKELRPDLWERTETVARIINPTAFSEGWIIEPASAAKTHALKLTLLRSNAMRRAQEVLQYLGVNTDTDWYELLTRLAEGGK